jgi:hypothetical protein
VHERLAAAIVDRFPGASCVADGPGLRVALTMHDAPYRARVQMEPVGRVAIQLPSTDGFELSVRWNGRAAQGACTPSFDDSCLVDTNDAALANLWLDGDARDALTVALVRNGSWHHELRGEEVMASRTEAETAPARMVDMLAASLALATRPVRWAKGFALIATALGGEAAPRVELGGRAIVRVRRNGTEVGVRLARRLGPADEGRLRTVVRADRVGEATLAPMRVDDRTRALVDAARPATTIVRPHDVEITFDGALDDRERLGAAVELAAYWAGERRHVGPYR